MQEIRWGWLAPAYAFSLLPPSLQACTAEDPTVAALTRASDLIFRGTLLRTGTSNPASRTTNSGRALVRIDEVLQASASLENQVGRKIALVLDGPLEAGEERVFFASARIVGKALGLVENGRAVGSSAALGAKVRAAQAELVREELSDRLSQAELVVSGRIVQTQPDALEPVRPGMRQAPRWRVAQLEVQSVLKGEVEDRVLAFRYPSSTDTSWALRPRPRVGDQGTWLLHARLQEEEVPSGAPLYSIVVAQDRLSDPEVEVALALRRR